MEMIQHALNWFEIPVHDFARAKAFYSAIFDFEMPEMDMGPNRMGFFLHDRENGVGGAIVQGPDMEPSTTGSVVYLNGGSNLSTVLDRVPGAGGRVIQPKTEVAPEMGFFAWFGDTEGNRVGLYSME